MAQVSLAALLKRHRGTLSLREMARRTGLSVVAIKALEDGDTLLPRQDTLPLLSAAYGIDEDSLARAVYGLYYEDQTPSTVRQLATAG
jgi:transcriptional regulator with XRE-family HTH domain